MEIVIPIEPEFRWSIPDVREVRPGLKSQLFSAMELTAKVALYAEQFVFALPQSVMATAGQSGQLVRTVFWRGRRVILDPFLIVFKVVMLVGYVALAIIFNAHTRAYNSIFYNSSSRFTEHPAAKYAGPNIDLTHVRPIKNDLDISHLGPDIQLEMLYQFFDASQFNQAQLNDDGTPCTKASLREGLETFIDNINNRTPFLGTPPAYQINELNGFYDHLKKAVLICIDKVKDDPEQCEVLSLAFAVAGKHCGGRYKAEALAALARLNTVSLETMQGTLEEKLWTILADKRLDIATRIIAENRLGTHGTPQFLRDFGDMLGLEGMQNVTEQINSQRLNPDIYVKEFFQRYTEDAIIDTIQAALRDHSGGDFRTKVMDWIIDQIGDWSNDEASIQELIGDCKGVRDSETSVEDKTSDLKRIYLVKGNQRVYQDNDALPLEFLSEDDVILEAAVRTFYQNHVKSPFNNKVAFRAALDQIGVNSASMRLVDLPRSVIRMLLVKNQILKVEDYIDRELLDELEANQPRLLPALLDRSRVKFLSPEIRSSRERALQAIFKEAFRQYPRELLDRFQMKLSLAKRCTINSAKFLSTIIRALIFKIALCAAFSIYTYPIITGLYYAIESLMLQIPYVGSISLILLAVSLILECAGKADGFYFELVTFFHLSCVQIWKSCNKLSDQLTEFHKSILRKYEKESIPSLFIKWKQTLPAPAPAIAIV